MPTLDGQYLDGADELSKKLKELGATVGGKALRSAAVSAMLPTLREAKQSIPKGTRAHKTYKGRIVAPGFASRQVRRKSSLSRDKTAATVRLGVTREAFYAVQFLERGTSTMRKQPWLVPAYNKTYKEVTKRFQDGLRKRIEKVAK